MDLLARRGTRHCEGVQNSDAADFVLQVNLTWRVPHLVHITPLMVGPLLFRGDADAGAARICRTRTHPSAAVASPRTRNSPIQATPFFVCSRVMTNHLLAFEQRRVGR